MTVDDRERTRHRLACTPVGAELEQLARRCRELAAELAGAQAALSAAMLAARRPRAARRGGLTVRELSAITGLSAQTVVNRTPTTPRQKVAP